MFLDAKSSDLPGAMWECPDLFRLGDRWFLVTSLFDAAPGRVMAVEGHFERERFVPTANGRLDLGRRWYAPQSFNAPDGRRVCFGWLREREDELPLAARGRVGVMSLPRQLLIGEDGSLGMAPVAELQCLRRAPFAPVPKMGPEGVLVLEAGRALSACEVDVTGTGAGPVLVDFLGDDDQPVLQVCAHGDEIDISARTAPLPPVDGPARARCASSTTTGSVRSSPASDG